MHADKEKYCIYAHHLNLVLLGASLVNRLKESLNNDVMTDSPRLARSNYQENRAFFQQRRQFGISHTKKSRVFRASQ